MTIFEQNHEKFCNAESRIFEHAKALRLALEDLNNLVDKIVEANEMVRHEDDKEYYIAPDGQSMGSIKIDSLVEKVKGIEEVFNKG